MLAPPPDNMMVNVRGHIPDHLLEEPNLQKLQQATEEEILGDYNFSSRKAISESTIPCVSFLLNLEYDEIFEN